MLSRLKNSFLPWRIDSKRPKRTDAGSYSLLLIIPFILTASTVLFYLGARAIQNQHHQSKWTSESSLALGYVDIYSTSDTGSINYTGADAITLGISFLSFGAFFLLWCLPVICAVMLSNTAKLPPRLVRIFLVLSLFTLTLGTICAYVPWQISSHHSHIFWLSVAYGALIGWLLNPLSLTLKPRYGVSLWPKRILALVALVYCVTIICVGSLLSLACALVLMLGLWLHIIALHISSQAAPEPQATVPAFPDPLTQPANYASSSPHRSPGT